MTPENTFIPVLISLWLLFDITVLLSAFCQMQVYDNVLCNLLLSSVSLIYILLETSLSICSHFLPLVALCPTSSLPLSSLKMFPIYSHLRRWTIPKILLLLFEELLLWLLCPPSWSFLFSSNSTTQYRKFISVNEICGGLVAQTYTYQF